MFLSIIKLSAIYPYQQCLLGNVVFRHFSRLCPLNVTHANLKLSRIRLYSLPSEVVLTQQDWQSVSWRLESNFNSCLPFFYLLVLVWSNAELACGKHPIRKDSNNAFLSKASWRELFHLEPDSNRVFVLYSWHGTPVLPYSIVVIASNAGESQSEFRWKKSDPINVQCFPPAKRTSVHCTARNNVPHYIYPIACVCFLCWESYSNIPGKSFIKGSFELFESSWQLRLDLLKGD